MIDGLSKQKTNVVANHTLEGTDFCSECGAWRGELGLEPSPELFVEHMVEVFREVRRVLKSTGTLWLNLGDSYASNSGGYDTTGSRGHTALISAKTQAAVVAGRNRVAPAGLKPKDLVGIPWRVALALQADGWYLRSDIIWHKSNPMPESVTDRPTKAHEYVFLLSKSEHYYYDIEAIKEPATEASIQRWSQNIEAQNGSTRTHAGARSNGPMKAVGGHKNLLEKGQRAHTMHLNRENGRAMHERNPMRNKRTVWEVPTRGYKGAHFATYPEKLILPCVLAGTSDHGCCSNCGAPWVRIVERGEAHSTDGTKNSYQPKKSTSDKRIKARSEGWTPNHRRDKLTTSWQPGCKCGAEVAPAIILDPFVGSGTTAAAAKRFRRNFIGIDLQGDNLALIKKRLNAVSEVLI